MTGRTMLLVSLVALFLGELLPVGASAAGKNRSPLLLGTERGILGNIDRFINRQFLEGVPFVEAKKLGKRAVPFLERIISRSKLEREHGLAIAALGAIGDVRALSSIESYVDSAKGEISLARFEAMLVAQSAIGMLAVHNDRALDYLLRRADPAFWDRQPWSFGASRDKQKIIMMRAVMNGLGISGRKRARERLEELGKTRQLGECANDNVALNQRVALALLRDDGKATTAEKISCIDASIGMPPVAPADCELVNQSITISYHIDTKIKKDRVPGSIVEASNLLEDANFRGDVACNVKFNLEGDVKPFGMQGNLDDFIQCPSQLKRVLCQPASRVKLVTSIVGNDLCDTVGYGMFSGCAEEPGMNILMVDPMTGSVLAHEFGHNNGLSHRCDSERRAIMNPFASGADGVNAEECSRFRSGGLKQ